MEDMLSWWSKDCPFPNPYTPTTICLGNGNDDSNLNEGIRYVTQECYDTHEEIPCPLFRDICPKTCGLCEN